jgi:hypothetical protein
MQWLEYAAGATEVEGTGAGVCAIQEECAVPESRASGAAYRPLAFVNDTFFPLLPFRHLSILALDRALDSGYVGNLSGVLRGTVEWLAPGN